MIALTRGAKKTRNALPLMNDLAGRAVAAGLRAVSWAVGCRVIAGRQTSTRALIVDAISGAVLAGRIEARDVAHQVGAGDASEGRRLHDAADLGLKTNIAGN